MFENIYNNKFKPLSENKLKSMLSYDELKIIPDNIDFKLFVASYCDGNQDKIKCSCGNYISYKTYRKGIFPASCSKSCATANSANKRNCTKYANFGSKENYSNYVSNLQKENSFKKYGETHQKKSREKTKSTMLSRYGVKHNSQLDSVKAKRQIIDNGVLKDIINSENSSMLSLKSRSKLDRKEIQNKAFRTRVMNSDINYDMLINPTKMTAYDLSNKAGCCVMTAYRYLNKAGLITKTYTQDTMTDYILDLGFECYETRKIIPPYELDIYIPEKNLAIEFNGLYWHSSGSREEDYRKSGYHLMKTELCESKGIQLLHVFENEWTDPVKQEIWKSVIRHKLGLSKEISAQKCDAKIINNPAEFLDKNHLEGSIISDLSIGLFHNDELVQVVTLGKPRYTKGYDWEILRMCTKNGYHVHNGFNKLLNETAGSIIMHANRRWSSTINDAYYNNSLKLLSVSAPCYWYIDRGNLYQTPVIDKHKLPGISEVDNCYANGLRRIWDCGNIIYCKE